jgi:prepilin-type N-terminal cleavage/methylation domain-containing protein
MDRWIMGKTMSSKNGFTLVELLIALVIVGVLMVTILSFMSNSMMLRKDSKNSEVAHLLGQDKLIELKAMANPVASRDTVVIDKVRYIRIWTITPASGANLLSTATVNVEYAIPGKTMTVKCSGGIQ